MMTEQEFMQELRKRYPWMNDDQFECWQMFCDLVGGAHHQFGKVRDAGPKGVEITEFAGSSWATFDFDRLTRAVVMAHDRCIRFSISPCNFNMLRFYLHKRDKREGMINEQHPTIDQAIAVYREVEARKAS